MMEKLVTMSALESLPPEDFERQRYADELIREELVMAGLITPAKYGLMPTQRLRRATRFAPTPARSA